MFNLSRSERLVVGGFAALALAYYFFEAQIFAWLSAQSPLVGILAYFVVNPAYALFLFLAYRLSKWEGVFAGAFILAAIDLAFFTNFGYISQVVTTLVPNLALVTRVILPVVLLVVAAFVSQNDKGLFSELLGL